MVVVEGRSGIIFLFLQPVPLFFFVFALHLPIHCNHLSRSINVYSSSYSFFKLCFNVYYLMLIIIICKNVFTFAF